ncbi:DUF3298 domain-containing protein [bacterium D16-51]|nr:DUF3298 domain-containing protein [bacterium D16-59]RKI62091.1 DUF3298 domain-containing protein [bacterium D16-51]
MRGIAEISKMKQDYETIPVPLELKQRVKEGIEQAKKEEDEEEGKIMKGKRISKRAALGLKITGGAAAALVALTLISNLNAPAARAMENIPLLGSIVKVVTFRTFESSEKEMSAKVKIPEVEVRDSAGKKNDAATKKINDAVDQYTQKIIDQYKADVEAVNGEGKEEVSVDYQVVTDNARLYSLKIDTVIALNTSGITVKIYHIDKETGKMVQLKDMFKEGTKYLSVLTEEIKNQMRQRMAEDDQEMYFIDDEDMPETNWKGLTEDANFYINKKGNLVFAFDKYEAAPGYMGTCEFEIPQELIKDMVKEEYFVK